MSSRTGCFGGGAAEDEDDEEAAEDEEPALHLLPLRIHLEQVGRDREHVARRLGLALLPRGARARRVELKRHVDLLLALEELEDAAHVRRHLDGLVAELDLEVLLQHGLLAARAHHDALEDALEEADPVRRVHYVVSSADLGGLERRERESDRRSGGGSAGPIDVG